MEVVKRKVYVDGQTVAEALERLAPSCKGASILKVNLNLIEGERYFATILKTQTTRNGARRLDQVEVWVQERAILRRELDELAARTEKILERIEMLDNALSENEG